MSAYIKPPDTPLVRLGKRLRRPLNRLIAKSSKLPNTPFLDRHSFPWVSMLEREAPAIRRELEPLIAERDCIPPLGQISPDHGRVAPSDKWRSFFFEAYGYKLQTNRQLCPATAACLDRIDDLVVAFFSIMEGGTHVPRHKGVSKALLNVHLALVVPNPPGSCRVSVDNEVRYWREGQVLILDDTYPHEVWNDSNELRAILFIQVRRPVGLLGRLLGTVFLTGVKRTSYVQEARAVLAGKALRRRGRVPAC